MSKSRKSNAKSLPRGSMYQDGQLVDTETTQKLFFHTHVCTIARRTLGPAENFVKADAQSFMVKNLKKRQSHGTMMILEDRFKLQKNKSGKEPFRSWLSYAELEEFNVDISKPEFFVLSINSQRSSSKYYEVYKCKSKGDVQKLGEYFRQAIGDPDFRIRDANPVGVLEMQPSENEDRRTIHDFEEQEDVEEYADLNEHPPSSPPTPPPHYSPYIPEHTQPIFVQSEPPVIQQERLHIQSAAPHLSQAVGNWDDLEDLTMIGFEPRTHQATVMDNGSIYLYCKRIPVNRSGWDSANTFHGTSTPEQPDVYVDHDYL